MGTEYLGVQTALPATGCMRQDLYDLVNQSKPTAEIVDAADSATDKTLGVDVNGRLHAALLVPRWRTFEVDFQSLDVAGLTAQVQLMELGAGGGLGVVHEVMVQHSIQWGGPAVSALSVTAGTSGAVAEFYGATTPYDLLAAPGAAVYGRRIIAATDAAAPSVSGWLQVEFTAVGANLNVLTSGLVKVHVLYSEVAA